MPAHTFDDQDTRNTNFRVVISSSPSPLVVEVEVWGLALDPVEFSTTAPIKLDHLASRANLIEFSTTTPIILRETSALLLRRPECIANLRLETGYYAEAVLIIISFAAVALYTLEMKGACVLILLL